MAGGRVGRRSTGARINKELSFDRTLFEPDEVETTLIDSGFSLIETSVRRAYDSLRNTSRMDFKRASNGDSVKRRAHRADSWKRGAA